MKKIAIQLIIFDLDGTLVDAYKPVASSVNSTLKELGYGRVGHQEIKRRVGWGDKNLIEQFFHPRDVDRALAFYRKHHRKALLRGTKFLPGAKKVLVDLKKEGFRLAIASNRPTGYTHIILRHLKISQYFDRVLCADKVKRAKPAPDLLREILKRCSLLNNQAIYVGDMTIDVLTGHKAKVRTLAVLTGSSTRKDIEVLKPLKIFRQVSAIVPFIRRLNKQASGE